MVLVVSWMMVVVVVVGVVVVVLVMVAKIDGVMGGRGGGII